MGLLGEVDELEIDGEGHGHVAGLLDGEIGDGGGQVTLRLDIARAVGREAELTADHDGVLVADVVAEWAQRHGSPYRLHLTGPAGGSWAAGDDGPELEDLFDLAYHFKGVDMIFGRVFGA